MALKKMKFLKWQSFLLICFCGITGSSVDARIIVEDAFSKERKVRISDQHLNNQIDPEFVGTWYPTNTLDHPLTENWDNKTFIGTAGFADFRTMVYTADGKSSIEYQTEMLSGVGYFYKYIGNVVQDGNTIRFYPVKGYLRIFRNGKISTERAMTQTEFNRNSYNSVLSNCHVDRKDGIVILKGVREIEVSYRKVTSTGSKPAASGGVYAAPPSKGSYVKIGAQYYPTVTIGNQEWMAENYAGPSPLAEGSVTSYTAVEDGKYYSWRDAEAIAKPENGIVPAGWRLPTVDDFKKLLASQSIKIEDYGYTATTGELEDGSSEAKNLYKLLANSRWPSRMDNGGSSANATGFAAIPSDFQNTSNRTVNGYNSNAYLWTSSDYGNNQAWSFNIKRLTNSITANFDAINKGGGIIILYPFRLVKDK